MSDHARLDDVTGRRLLESLEFPFERPKTVVWYRIALVFVALLMLLLPAVYAGIVVGVGYAMVWHAIHDVSIFESSKGSHAVFAYVAPLFVGGILLYFLLKPLVARSRRVQTGIPVDRRREPYLFEFVAALCKTVGAPSPRSVHVDCDVNASVGFHQGTAGLFGGRRTLTIGLPLAAALTVGELTGVLAHELGHMAQGTGMRMGYAIRFITGWFKRAVFERDGWDEALVASSKGRSWITAVALIARGIVWLTRRILFGFLWVGEAMSCWFSRHLEIDADAVEASVVGGDVLANALRRMPMLGIASGNARTRLASTWEERRLADDIPALIRFELDRLPPDTSERVMRELESETRGWFATHPSVKERIEAAFATGASARFASDLPARLLFGDFEPLCREATLQHYKSTLGRAFSPKSVLPVTTLVGWDDQIQADVAAQERYFCGCANTLCPIPLTFAEAPTLRQASGGAAAIAVRREAASKAAARAVPLLKTAYVAWERFHLAECAMALVNAGIEIDAGAFGLEGPDRAACRSASSKALDEIAAARTGLRPLLAHLGSRLLEAVNARPTQVHADGTPPLESLVSIARCMTDLMPLVEDVRIRHDALASLVSNGSGRSDEQFTRTLRAVATLSWQSLAKLRQELPDQRYPFDHGGGVDFSIVKYVVPRLDSGDEVSSILAAGDLATERMQLLYFRVLGRLASVAEGIERGFGFEPLVASGSHRRP